MTIEGVAKDYSTADLHSDLRKIVEGPAGSVCSIFGTSKMEPGSSDVKGMTDSAILHLPNCRVLGDGTSKSFEVRSHYPNEGGPGEKYWRIALKMAGHSTTHFDDLRNTVA